jgi:DNA-binding XRE family transcriptional regulator
VPEYLGRPVLQKADPKLVYAAQVRAARALLGWSQGELAERAGISKQSVNRIESGNMDARLSTVSALGEAFRSAGVEMGEDAAGVIRISVPSERLGSGGE